MTFLLKIILQTFSKRFFENMMMMMMMMMIMMNCFCGMIERRKAFSLISSRDHCQRFLPSRISNTPRTRFDPAQNLSSGLVELSCAAVITTTLRRYDMTSVTNAFVGHFIIFVYTKPIDFLMFLFL